MLTRREMLFAVPATMAAAVAGNGSRLSVEGYIFQQYAARQKKSLSAVLEEAINMSRLAGFVNIELNQGFFAPELRDRLVKAVRANQLRMPSVYVGGAMHTPDAAAKTTDDVMTIAEICKEFGCAAIVNNPSPKPQGAEKTDDELRVQGEELNRLGEQLRSKGFELRIHNHTPEMVSNAREFRSTLKSTDPKLVSICLDIDWVYQGGMDPLALLREAASRVTEIHVRSSKDKLWLESFEKNGDVDYRKVAATMKELKITPLVVVELAYRDNTVVKRPLADDLRHGRVYAEDVFDIV